MKKILLLLVGAIVSFVANAALYVVGNDPSIGNYELANALVISETSADGYYHFKAPQGKEFQMAKNSDGKWDGTSDCFNANTLYRDGEWSESNGVKTIKTTLTWNGSNDNRKFTLSDDFLYVRVSADYTEVQVSKTEDFGGGEVTHTYKIKSAVDGSDWPLHDMEPDGTGKYVYTYVGVTAASSARGLGMEIDGKWRGTTQTGKTFDGRTLSCYMKATSNGNIEIAASYAGDIKCTFDPDTEMLTLEKPGGDDDRARLHIHTMAMLNGQQIFPFDLEGENPYKVSITINAPLADDLPLCVHRRQGSEDYVGYGFSERMTYVPLESGNTNPLVELPADENANIVLPKGLKGTITFAVNMVENLPKELTISGGEIAQNLYTYVLWDNFNSTSLTETQEFYAHTGHFDVKYTFTGEETGRLFKVERKLNGQTVSGRRWCVVRNSAEYVPSPTGTFYDQLSATGTDNIVLPEGILGEVTISVYVDEEGVPNRFHIQGGHLGEGPEQDYVIYFYDTTANGDHNAPYAYMWRKEAGDKTSEFTTWWPADQTERDRAKMVATNKYIKDGENYYPVYKLAFSWGHMIPHFVIIHNDGTKYTEGNTDLTFVNGGWYHSDATTARTDLSEKDLVDKPGEIPATFYMHWKEDWIQDSQKGADGNPLYVPRCYIYSGNIGDTSNDEVAWNIWNNAKEMTTIDELAPSISTDPNMLVADGEQMTITEKYQIWKCDFTGQERKGKENVCFVMMSKDKKPWVYASRSEGFAEPDYLTRYIFATADEDGNRYAVQSFIPYDDFKQLDRQGRPYVYLVGNEDGAIKGLQWSPLAIENGFAAEDGCFYIKLDVGNTADAKFKMSWINPKDAIVRNNVTKGADDNQRAWATFDLGIFGVDDTWKYPAGYDAPAMNWKDDANDKVYSVKCESNKSIRYLNYNQYNWYVEKSQLTSDSPTWYIVVDPHSTCRTVTLIPYDPNPSVTLTTTGFGTIHLDEAQARIFHGDHSSHLNGASYNGHIYMQDLNVCSGTVKIKKSHEALKENFDLKYSIYMNNDLVLEHENPDDVLSLKYMPLGASGEVGIRASYENKTTHLTFHSKLGTGVYEGATVSFPQPTVGFSKACKVMDPGVESNPAMRGRIGVLVEDISFQVEETPYIYYTDFNFDQGDRAEILHGDHRVVKAYPTLFGKKTLSGWEFVDYDNNYEFTEAGVVGKNNWSGHFADAQKNASIYLTNTGEDVTTVEGKVYAVYPFFYQVNPTIDNPSSAPRRAANDQTSDLPADLDNVKYHVTNVYIEQPVEVAVQDGVISGIENVAVDADADADVEYFTVSGVRVTGDPAPGVYLMRKGSTVTKVIVR